MQSYPEELLFFREPIKPAISAFVIGITIIEGKLFE